MILRLIARLLFRLLAPPAREPDFVIGDRQMLRWHLVPRNDYFNIYLHHICRSDDNEALHDHPYWSISLCLRGVMFDVPPHPKSWVRVRQGSIMVRPSERPHRLVVDPGDECWTLFITGPRIREWGFHCPRGWRHWEQYRAARKAGGRGCGE